MDKNNVVDFQDREGISNPLTELLKSGARRLLMQAIETEIQEYMAPFADLESEDGKAAVVRNGCHPGRQIQTGIGPVPVKIPKVRSKTGKPLT